MQARRVLLLFAIVLLLTAAAASFVPVPEDAGRTPGDAAPTEAEPVPGPSGEDREPVELRFEAGERPRAERVERGQRVVVTVDAPEPGEAELRGLGRLATVEPLTPAVFDLFIDRPGTFDVVFTPVDGSDQRLGTLVVGGRDPRPLAKPSEGRA